MNRLSALLTGVLLLVAAPERPAGQAASAQRVDQPYASGATAILVDVVVRDRRGHPVTDLTVDDFQVEEDGVTQRVDSFTRVSRGGGIGINLGWRVPETPVALPTGPVEAADQGVDTVDSTTALVFHHLPAEPLGLAQRATLDYVPMSGESRVRVGVFAIGPGVRVIQGYTTDRTRVRQAVARIVPAGTAAADDRLERSEDLIARRRQLREQPDEAVTSQLAAAGGNLVGLPSSPGQRAMEMQLVQTELNMLRAFDSMDRDHRGYDTALALLSVVRSLAEYPGRKTIVFFSQGLPVTPVLSARLERVIEAANRANVTAYAVDADGLRAKSTSAALKRELETFADERMHQNATGVASTQEPLTMAIERVEDTLTLDSRTGLARLARETGGFLVEGSNDLSAAFRRIDEDHRFHYLLTYTPTNTAFDGTFREIRVKVRRPGTQVFARRGYRAIRNPGPDAASYEAPARAMLEREPLPNAFPIHAAAFNFPDPRRPGLTPALVQVRTDVLHFTVDAAKGTYSGQVAIVVRIRDGQGQEVQTLSQDYLLAGDARDRDAARQGEILFYREADLPPGIYTIESVVFDAGSARGSARVATLTVPAADPSALGMSSLVLVSRVEEVDDPPADATGPAAPLYVGRTLLYPNLGTPVRRSTAAELPFYFTLYGATPDVRVSAELLRGGRPFADAPVPLPPSTGPVVQHVGRLPVGALPAGTYELRIRVADGRQELSRTAFFTLVD